MVSQWRRIVAAFLLGAALFTTVPVWGQDLNTLLTNFLVDLRSGAWGVRSPITSIKIGSGTSSAPSLTWAAQTDTGWYLNTSDGNRSVYVSGGTPAFTAGATIVFNSSGGVAWSSSASDPSTGSLDVSLKRGAADRMDLASGDSLNLVLGKIGYGAQAVTVDGATTFAVTAGYITLACTGAETINTITGGLTGMTLVIEHTDTDCTIADDDAATASNAIDLTGTGTNDVGAAKKIITLLYTGTDWVQISESDN